MTPAHPRQNGNMLFIVLIGIALLGFLTLIISRSSENTEDTGSTEQLTIQATEIMRYSGGMKEAFQNMVSRGCSEYQVTFYNAAISGYSNLNAPASNACHVFDIAGGGMKNLSAKTSWLDTTLSAGTGYGEWNVSNDVCVEGVGADDASCDGDSINNEETVLWLGYLTESMCKQINKTLGVTNTSDAPPVAAYAWAPASRYIGVVDEGGRLAATELAGKKAGCFEDAGGIYVFYQVLAVH